MAIVAHCRVSSQVDFAMTAIDATSRSPGVDERHRHGPAGRRRAGEAAGRHPRQRHVIAGTSAGCSTRPRCSACRQPRPNNIPEKLGPTVAGTRSGSASRTQARVQRGRLRPTIFERWKSRRPLPRARLRHRNPRLHPANGVRPDGRRLGWSTSRSTPSARAHAIDHETALRRMESAGVILTSTEAAMFEWCRDAGHARVQKNQRARQRDITIDVIIQQVMS